MILVHAWHSSRGEKRYTFDDFMTEAIVILLIGLTEQLIELNLQLEQGTETNKELMYYLLRTRGLLGDLGRRLHTELSTTLQKEDGGFQCCNRHLAIHSYEEFWQLLLENPKKKHVQALHTGEVRVFNPDQEQPLLELQSQFVNGGGKIARVLCYRHEVDKLPDNIESLAKLMLKRKIDVHYCDRRRVPQLQKIEWDFLRVAETKEAAVWTMNPDGMITGASFTDSREYEGVNLESLWEQVKERSHVLKLDPATGKLSW